MGALAASAALDQPVTARWTNRKGLLLRKSGYLFLVPCNVPVCVLFCLCVSVVYVHLMCTWWPCLWNRCCALGCRPGDLGTAVVSKHVSVCHQGPCTGVSSDGFCRVRGLRPGELGSLGVEGWGSLPGPLLDVRGALLH